MGSENATPENVIVSGNDIILSDLYDVNSSGNMVSFTLRFNNIGVATTTDVFLGPDQKASDEHGSLIDFPVDTNTNVAKKFLKIYSVITTTNLTPLPDHVKVDFIIKGGARQVSYPLPDYQLNEAGDSVNLDISIFFFLQKKLR